MKRGTDSIYKIKNRLLAYSPNLKESLLLLAYIFISLMILAFMTGFITAGIRRIFGIAMPEAWRGPLYVLQEVIVIAVIINRLGKHSNYVPISPPRQSPLLCLFFVLFVLSIIVATEPLRMWMERLVSKPDLMKQIEAEYSRNNLSAFIVRVIGHPILEEWLCRGIILKGLLARYSPFKVIIWSAALVSVICLPWSALEAFCFTLMIGWIYWQTKSLWCCMLMHMASSAAVFFAKLIFIRFFKPVNMDVIMIADLAGGYYIYPVALFVCALAIIGIKKVIVPYDATFDMRNRQEVSV